MNEAIFAIMNITWAVDKNKDWKKLRTGVQPITFAISVHNSDVAKVMGPNSVQAWIFFTPYFHYCK